MRGGKPGFYPEIKGKGGPGGHFLLNLWDPFGFTTKRTASLRRPCPHFTPSPRRLLDGVAVGVSHAARWHTGALAPRHDSVKDYRCDRLTRRCTTQAEQKERGLKCEILNGRAAMVGIMGMLSASTVRSRRPAVVAGFCFDFEAVRTADAPRRCRAPCRSCRASRASRSTRAT